MKNLIHSRCRISFAVIAAFLAAPLSAHAAPTFGAEFEFTTQQMLEDEGSGLSKEGHERQAAENFMKKVTEKCPECKITPQRFKWGNEYLVTYPDGWWFRISYDPGCVEIQTKPSTHDELVAIKDRMEKDIFGTAHDTGMTTDEEVGGGHMNFGTTSTFGDDTDLFMDFVADFADHPQLAEGAWGQDYMNAPPLNYLKQYQRDAMLKIMQDARDHKIASIKEAAHRIQKEVYTETTDPGDAGYHYQAMGLKKLNQAGFPTTDAPTEIRSMFPQKSAEDFIKEAEIISRRVAFLKETNQPIVYFNIRQQVMTDQNIVDNYYVYLTEMGMDWDRYKTTMRSDLQEIEPGDFVRGNVTWDAEYAESAQEFIPYIRTSSWTRKRLFDALTHFKARGDEGAARTLMKVIDSTKADSPTIDTEVQFIKDVLDQPVWRADPARNGIIRYLRAKLPNTDFSELGPSKALIGPVKPATEPAPSSCEKQLLGL